MAGERISDQQLYKLLIRVSEQQKDRQVRSLLEACQLLSNFDLEKLEEQQLNTIFDLLSKLRVFVNDFSPLSFEQKIQASFFLQYLTAQELEQVIKIIACIKSKNENYFKKLSQKFNEGAHEKVSRSEILIIMILFILKNIESTYQFHLSMQSPRNLDQLKNKKQVH